MKWSWHIGKIAGVDVFIHATFLLLIGFVVLTHWLPDQDFGKTLEGVIFTLALFGCVLLHEFGHALAARRYGVRTRDITLLPIGGVARLERMPEEPVQELWVALAGPAVNVIIALALLPVVILVSGMEPLSSLSLSAGPLLERLLMANVFLALFNLLPAFPMDGGRVLRALLALRLSYAKATKIAGSIGQGMALLFGFAGLFGNPFLLFIAFFVWIGAAQESAAAQLKSVTSGMSVREAMMTDYHTLTPKDSLARATDYVLRGSQEDFPVADNGKVVGILTKPDLIAALARHGQHHSVGEAMHRLFETAEENEVLDVALSRLQGCGCPTLPVTRHGELVGMISMGNLAELLMIRNALESAATKSAGDGRFAFQPLIPRKESRVDV
jgi:Zn-dependent protease/predicted transcriptional regulator